MDTKSLRLPIALLLLALMAVATFVALDRRDAPGESATVERVSPTRGLDRAAITALEITRPGQPVTRLEIREDEYAIVEPFSAKADASAVNQMLDRLVDIEIDSVAATRAQHHEKLEVSDERAIQVRVHTGDELAADLRIGARRGRSTMLREAGSPNVLGAAGGLRHAFDKTADALRDKRIFDLDESSVTEVTFEGGDRSLSFSRPSADEPFAVADGSAPVSGFDPAKVRSRVVTLSRLRASRFAPDDVTRESAGLEPPAGTVSIAIGETRHTLLIGGDAGGGTYAAVADGEEIFVLPAATAKRFMPEPDDFAASAEPPPPPPPSGGEPSEIPPELLERIQRELGQQ